MANSSSGGRPFHPLDPRVILGGVIVVVLGAAVVGPWNKLTSDDPDDFVGGCAAFTVYAQNQFDPVGTKVWAEPRPTADNSHGFAPNELVKVDGWVRTQTPYPSNSSPWDSDAWFHLSNGAGWVSFAGVRSVPTDPSQGNFAAGPGAVPLDQDCDGRWRQS